MLPQRSDRIEAGRATRWYIARGQRDTEQEERANQKYARTQRACGNLARSEFRRQIRLIRRHSAYKVGCATAGYRAEQRQGDNEAQHDPLERIPTSRVRLLTEYDMTL